MNFYKHFMGDYAKKTSRLTLAQHGAYHMLIDAYYSEEKPLPADYDDLYRIARAMDAKERDAVRMIADAFFPIAADGLRHNERCDEEVLAYQAQAETNRQIAVERERKRKEHEQSTNRGTKQEPSQSQSHKELKNLDRDGFAIFWDSYPRKVAKPKAESAWKKQRVSVADRELILAAIEASKQSDSWQKNAGEFIPHPASWINARRWEDQLEVSSRIEGVE